MTTHPTETRAERTDRPKRLIHDPKALRRRRLLAGYSQLTLAHAAAVSPNHYCNVENGNRSTSVELLHRLANALNCEVEELLAE